MINLIIADDHQKFRSSLAEYLSSIPGFSVIGEASDGRELIEVVEDKKEFAPFIIMDVNMPVMDGITTTAYLAKQFENTRVIGMSVSNDFNHLIRMFRAGAKGFIWKSALSECITEAIQQIQANEYYADPSFAVEMEAYVKENGNPAQWKKLDISFNQDAGKKQKTSPGIFSRLKNLFSRN